MVNGMPAPTPEEWRDRLVKAINDRSKAIDLLDDYYDGDHPLPEGPITDATAKEYRKLLEQSRTNWPRLIVTAAEERLEPIGFRPGPSGDPIDPLWALWQANSMDSDASLAHSSALTVGSSYVVVWPDDDLGATLSIEHAGQTIVAYGGATRRTRVAALKIMCDDWGHPLATLYLPDAVHKWASPRKVNDSFRMVGGNYDWQPRIVVGEDWPLVNPLGRVPVIELMANPRLRWAPFGWGRSEFGDVLPVIDRINRTTFHRSLAGDFAAVPQKAIIGWAPPDGTTLPVRTSVDRIWTFDNPEVSVTQFAAADLSNYTKAIEADVTHLAAITHTPPHYLLGTMVNISAQALAAAEAGLVAKVRRHQRTFGEGWEEVMRLAGRAAGIEGTEDLQLETVWRNPETRSDAERADAAVKLNSVGVPWGSLMEYLGYTSQAIARMRTQRITERLANPQPLPQRSPVPVTGNGAVG